MKLYFKILIVLFFNAKILSARVVPTQRALIGSSACMGAIIGGLTGLACWLHGDAHIQRIWQLGGVISGLVGGLVTYNVLQSKKKNYLETCSLDDFSYDPKISINLNIKDHVKPVKLSDVIGLDDVLIDIIEIINYLKHKKTYDKMGATMPKGILLEGPPGTGKTMIARALACETDCTFLYASASSFVEMHVGVGARRIRDLFEQARASKPVIIFIDELDAIGAVSRDAGANEEYRQTLNELLCQLDGFEELSEVIVLAATNNAKSLDAALKRSGRFDRIIKVPLLNQVGRYCLLKHLQKSLPSIKLSQSFVKKLSLETEGLTAADLKNIFNEAALMAVRDQVSMINEEHVERATQKIINERKKL